MPGVVKLGGDPDLLSRDAGVLDTLANLGLVAVCEGSVDVAVASEEGSLDGLTNLVGLGLPGTETNSGNLSALWKVLVVCFFKMRILCQLLTVLRVKAS